jgi:hypothetical protein
MVSPSMRERSPLRPGVRLGPNLRVLLALGVLPGLLIPPIGCGSVTKASSDGGNGGNGGHGESDGGPTDAAGEAGADTAPPTIDQACGAYAADVCNALGACGPLVLQLFYGDAATCVTRQTLSCATDQKAAGITRTTTDIVACGAAARATACPDVLAGNVPTACQVKPGTVVNGGSCGSSWQCQSTHCEKPTAACGTCASRQPASGACTGDDGCNVGLVCANKKCVVPGAAGSSCDNNNPCRGDLYCTGSGSCATLVEVGGSCADSASACNLANGAGCNPLDKTCVAVAIAQGGEPCGVVNGTFTLCVEGDACPNLTLTHQTSVCANPAADGAACGSAAPGQNCVPPATCQMTLCRLPSVDSCQ